jgi:hypothetical protein
MLNDIGSSLSDLIILYGKWYGELFIWCDMFTSLDQWKMEANVSVEFLGGIKTFFRHKLLSTKLDWDHDQKYARGTYGDRCQLTLRLLGRLATVFHCLLIS